MDRRDFLKGVAGASILPTLGITQAVATNKATNLSSIPSPNIFEFPLKVFTEGITRSMLEMRNPGFLYEFVLFDTSGKYANFRVDRIEKPFETKKLIPAYLCCEPDDHFKVQEWIAVPFYRKWCYGQEVLDEYWQNFLWSASDIAHTRGFKYLHSDIVGHTFEAYYRMGCFQRVFRGYGRQLRAVFCGEDIEISYQRDFPYYISDDHRDEPEPDIIRTPELNRGSKWFNFFTKECEVQLPRGASTFAIGVAYGDNAFVTPINQDDMMGMACLDNTCLAVGFF